MYKTALITGASDGLGKQLALQLAEKGVENFIICGRNEEKLSNTSKQLQNMGKTVFQETFDLSDLQKTQQFVEKAISTFKNIDLLINNAGANTNKATIEQLDINELDWMMKLNCIAPTLLMKEIIPTMKEIQHGMIVNILSTVCKHDIPEFCGYAASKCAFESMNNTTRKQVKDFGINVFTVYPGGIDSNFRSEDRPLYLKPEQLAKLIIQNLFVEKEILMQELLVRPRIENNY